MSDEQAHPPPGVSRMRRSRRLTCRDTRGARLADEVLTYVSPTPPVGTRPEDFLAAVIASRRQRDLARLEREAALRARLVDPR